MGAPVHQPTETKGRKPVAEVPVPPPAGSSPAAVEAYRRISGVYDVEPNPVLALERRYLARLLPPTANRDVLDLGCGTGRWLDELATGTPRSLTGVDVSPAMLAEARRKLGDRARLLLASCTSLPLPHASADLILCSFVANYVADLYQLAEQIGRMLRPGALAFVTDLHPATTEKLGWRRGFQVAGEVVEVPAASRSIPDILAALCARGLQVDAILEPEFGEPEREIFERAGKMGALRAALNHPAIYILQARLRASRARQTVAASSARSLKHLFGGRLAFGAAESVRADVSIENGLVEFVGNRDFTTANRGQRAAARSLDLSGFLLLPGLVNAHDHLEFALFPRLGGGGYRDFSEWANDIHKPDQPPVREHRAVPKHIRLWWGAIRNLLAGVTTVCEHNPYVSEVFDNGFAIRVLRDFDWQHSLQVEQGNVRALGAPAVARPFIIHLAEGVTPESAEEIVRLASKRALDDRTVIVHGVGLDDRGLASLDAAGASLIWCPTSNVFLFGRSLSWERVRDLRKVALASDSPLTAQGDLLNEIRFAHDVLGVPAEHLYALVTTRSAEVLRLQTSEGAIRVGGVADFVAVRDQGSSPASTMVRLTHEDIQLVVIGGCVQLASAQLMARLPRLVAAGLRPLDVEGHRRWIRAPLRRMFAETCAHLSGEIRLGGKRIRHALPA